MADPWFRLDKLEHFLGCAILQIGLLLLLEKKLARYTTYPPAHHLTAFALTFLAGLAKELGDKAGLWYGQFSLRDLLADVLGALAGSIAFHFYRQHQQLSGPVPAQDIETGRLRPFAPLSESDAHPSHPSPAKPAP